MNANPTFVVRTHAPRRVRALAAAAVGAVLVAGYVLYSWGALAARAELESATQTAALKQTVAKALGEEVQTLRAENVRLKRERAVSADARRAIDTLLRSQREQIGRLREESAFYRTLALPADDARAASTLLEFKLYHRNRTERRYRFTVWVARVRAEQAETSAELALKVLGRKGGEMLELEGRELGDAAAFEAFAFTNFQRLDGVITLPSQFAPEAVALELSMPGDGEAVDRTVRIFPWTEPPA